MPAPAAQKVTYQSLYRYTVDANRRVQMPLAWRTSKPVELMMIVWPQHECGPDLDTDPRRIRLGSLSGALHGNISPALDGGHRN